MEVREYDGDYLQNGFSRRGIEIVNLSNNDEELELEVANKALKRVSEELYKQAPVAINSYIQKLREKGGFQTEEELRDIFEKSIGIDGGVHYHQVVFDPSTDNHAPIFINW